jgi:hypothetical protein
MRNKTSKTIELAPVKPVFIFVSINLKIIMESLVKQDYITWID